ncbi:hypothetical protein BN14_06576 [Rhizoctonia solani AG-1 IB]|uniref:USP domain-containing protein n=1 Tax=Thanatephorus cucumeris (strain AG1-IB / isolate 7/3/14) TaxID=1108050 RepID=M5BZ77_THACB|nr:hypothetical protein BN14_06576 [Rhizoctonia solani AG-1 IB]
MGAGSPVNNNLADILEYHIAADGLGFVRETLPDALAFKVVRSAKQPGGTGKFGFPSRLWFDRWVADKRDFVLRTVKAREKDIEEQLKRIESENLKLKRCEGRDTLADLRACIRHFEHTATDGGDPKRKVRNENTLGKLNSVLKDIEDKLAVVFHDGLLGRAHIFSYIRYNGKWWKVVDGDVTEASEETVLGDSSGVHLGSGAFLMLYSKPTEEKESPWPRKDRIKSQKLDEEFRATLPPTVRFKFEKSARIISPADSDEEEYMDAEESITVETDPVVDEVRELADNKPNKQGDESDQRRDDGMQDAAWIGQKQAEPKDLGLVDLREPDCFFFVLDTTAPSPLPCVIAMASSQVVGRHEVFEYSYRVGPKDARKRIKLVVIQRREQRRKSLVAAGRIFEHAPVRLRLNLHRAKYGDPEIVSGARQVPITLRRKAKPAPNTIIVQRKVAQPQPTVIIQQAKQKPTPPPKENVIMIQPAPPINSQPRRIALVDQPRTPPESTYGPPESAYGPPESAYGPPGSAYGPPEVVVIPPTQTPSPETVIIDRPPSRTSSVGSVTRPKVKRSNSLTNSFRRFPSLMGLIRRNSRDRGSGTTVVSEGEHGDYVDIDPRTSQEDVIIEERERDMGLHRSLKVFGLQRFLDPWHLVALGVLVVPVPCLSEAPKIGLSRHLPIKSRCPVLSLHPLVPIHFTLVNPPSTSMHEA